MTNLLEHQLLVVLLGSFLGSWLFTLAFCYGSHSFSFGQDLAQGVQKFHVKPTSRLGGVAIALGLCTGAGALALLAPSSDLTFYTLWFLIACTPVWLGGLLEDLTHRIGPTLRLVLATVSAALLYDGLGVAVTHTDVWPIDLILLIPGAVLCTTLLVVAGFTHSVNIIDGFHGLACGLVMITVSGLSLMAWRVGDLLLLQMCLVSLAAMLGFFVLNWPNGGIFLGDAGAYLIGFWVVELGLLLAMRNPSISPMAPVVAGILPLIETLFSIYRRKVIRQHPVNHPDGLHLHTLVYRRLLYNPQVHLATTQKNRANAQVAAYFWLPATAFTTLACLFMQNTLAQLALMLIYLAMYSWLYRALVHFKAPKPMNLRRLSLPLRPK
jgi:UDP-N-acetylmuramyl pentapeptide phosphotransferase/UDP-N-acetylglucosamine-1-phosphate transferase